MGDNSHYDLEQDCLATLQDIVCGILSVDQVDIESSFLELGGDSLTAIEVGTSGNVAGIAISVSDVMRGATLRKLAELATAKRTTVPESTLSKPWSLIPSNERDDISDLVKEQCWLGRDETIEDVYPTTALQQGLIMLAAKQPGSYTNKSIMPLTARVNVDRFRIAWEQTLHACELLRTRIILRGSQTLQVVVQGSPKWQEAHSEAACLRQMSESRMEYGTPLCNYWLIDDGAETKFGIAIHHVIFDGWSVRLVAQLLAQCYDDQAVSRAPVMPYSRFIKYTMDLDKAVAAEFWRRQLHGASPPSFPPSPVGMEPVNACRSHRRNMPFQLRHGLSSTFTRASILRAAWALVLIHEADTDKTVFGATTTGRQAPVEGVQAMAGQQSALCR